MLSTSLCFSAAAILCSRQDANFNTGFRTWGNVDSCGYNPKILLRVCPLIYEFAAGNYWCLLSQTDLHKESQETNVGTYRPLKDSHWYFLRQFHNQPVKYFPTSSNCSMSCLILWGVTFVLVSTKVYVEVSRCPQESCCISAQSAYTHCPVPWHTAGLDADLRPSS